jgi:energy-coupling factor transporter ATP-binding protein EcfA2
MPKWFLRSIEITGGFLPGLSLQLPHGLTCIIGPRGSGKSTLAEALRYGIGGMARSSNAPLVNANLGNSTLTIVTSPPVGELGYTVRRGFKQPPSLITSEGKSIESLDLDRGTFLPLDAYTSGEIEAIANEALGEKRRRLLDDLREEELRSVLLTINDARRGLAANADAIQACRRTTHDITEQIEEIGDARAKLAALPPAPAGTTSEHLERLSHEQQASSNEIDGLDEAINWLEAWRTAYDRFSDDQRHRLPRPGIRPHSVNTAVVSGTLEELENLLSFADQHFLLILEKIDETVTNLKRSRQKIESVLAIQTAEVSKLQQQDSAVGQAIRERSLVQQAVDRLNGLESRLNAEKLRLRELLDARRSLKADYLLKTEKIYALRAAVAADLQRRIGDFVRIRVLRNADNLAYQQMLLQALRGARVRNHDEILAGLMRLRPEQLAQIIQENDLAEFETLLSFGQERSSRILEAFRSALNPLQVEVTEIEDQVSIELNVGTAAQPIFKDAAALSQGQKCTALLPLLLSRREIPLLIDQPEDNLDNHFIFETVVDAIRRLREVRQMIFITHNANIPVLGEADLIVVMNSDGKRGFIQKAGSLDECRDEIVDLLEGGEKAFAARSKRYGK